MPHLEKRRFTRAKVDRQDQRTTGTSDPGSGDMVGFVYSLDPHLHRVSYRIMLSEVHFSRLPHSPASITPIKASCAALCHGLESYHKAWARNLQNSQDQIRPWIRRAARTLPAHYPHMSVDDRTCFESSLLMLLLTNKPKMYANAFC